jgi:uncharacterized protein (DUF983 family)
LHPRPSPCFTTALKYSTKIPERCECVFSGCSAASQSGGCTVQFDSAAMRLMVSSRTLCNQTLCLRMATPIALHEEGNQRTTNGNAADNRTAASDEQRDADVLPTPTAAPCRCVRFFPAFRFHACDSPLSWTIRCDDGCSSARATALACLQPHDDLRVLLRRRRIHLPRRTDCGANSRVGSRQTSSARYFLGCFDLVLAMNPYAPPNAVEQNIRHRCPVCNAHVGYGRFILPLGSCHGCGNYLTIRNYQRRSLPWILFILAILLGPGIAWQMGLRPQNYPMGWLILLWMVSIWVYDKLAGRLVPAICWGVFALRDDDRLPPDAKPPMR